MFTDMIKMLQDKQDRDEVNFTLNDVKWLFEKIILHLKWGITRNSVRKALVDAIEAYDWIE